MGNSSSSRRRRRHRHHQQQQDPGPIYPPLPPPPPGYHTEISPCPHVVSPYYYRPPRPGSYFFHQQQGYFPPPPPPPPPAPHHFLPPPPPLPAAWNVSTAIVPALPAPVPEYQTPSTVRNEVNLNKGTLRLEKDEAVPGNHVVAFSFDATIAGSISVFFLSREISNGSVVSLSTLFPPPRKHHFKSGLGQKFKQESGLDFSLIDEQDLSEIGPDNIYPLIIRIETSPKNPSPEAESPEPVGGAISKWKDCQQTYAVIRKLERDTDEAAEFEVKVVKQIIWIDGVRYELQEIFGMGGSEASNNSNDSGKECVICLSEPKDTTLLPCRHMCMCSDCANVLRHQTRLCPICRSPVEELIHMKV